MVKYLYIIGNFPNVIPVYIGVSLRVSLIFACLSAKGETKIEKCCALKGAGVGAL